MYVVSSTCSRVRRWRPRNRSRDYTTTLRRYICCSRTCVDPMGKCVYRMRVRPRQSHSWECRRTPDPRSDTCRYRIGIVPRYTVLAFCSCILWLSRRTCRRSRWRRRTSIATEYTDASQRIGTGHLCTLGTQPYSRRCYRRGSRPGHCNAPSRARNDMSTSTSTSLPDIRSSSDQRRNSTVRQICHRNRRRSRTPTSS
jgi:hypothetical protein